jgi:exopolyphosphatase/guanosine-5'-triphosphate,3'-diphosphate pyrophosphatase
LYYLKPKEALFTATGLREGTLYDQLSPHIKKQDPLLSGCQKIAIQTSRFGTERTLLSLAKWAEPIFIKNLDGQMRILKAACLLSDFGWFEHEDHRAMHAYYRILRMPLYGMDHGTRAKLALSAYVRYRGYIRENRNDGITAAAQSVLTKKQVNQAVTLGLLMRLAYVLTAGSLDLLKYTELKITDKVLRLVLTDKATHLKGEIIQDSLDLLAKRLGRRAIISIQ